MLGSWILRGPVPAAMALLAACRPTPPPSSIPPNVVLISIDSLRADHVSGYGYERETSPQIDRLAKEGALFENAIAESSWTLPTHVSMLTGLSSSVHGVELDPGSLAASVPTLASRLREAGYETKGIYSGPYLHPVFGFATGFDEYEGVFGDDASIAESMHAASDEAARRRAVLEANRAAHRTVTSPEVTGKAIEYIRREREKPFFLFLHYFDVHYDYIPPPSAWKKFDPDYAGTGSFGDFARNPAIGPDMDPDHFRHLIALYDGEIVFTDEHIGVLLDALDEKNLGERTLVVVTSDHGEEFFEHGRKGHRRTLHDEVLKVPLVARLPGRIPAGLRVKEQVRQVDLMPTILSLLSIELRDPVSGKAVAFAPSLPDPGRASAAVSRLLNVDGSLWISARTREHKYLVNVRPDSRRELFYDLARDPGEKEPMALSSLPEADAAELHRLRQAVAAVDEEERPLRAIYGSSPGGDVEVPADVLEQLRALGYVP